MVECPSIEGAENVVKWFGHWPTFHDAEVVSVVLNRAGKSRVEVHAFETTSDMDAAGYFRCTKHAIVTFELEGYVPDEVGSICLRWFNHQNVLSGLTVRPVVSGYEVILDGIFGVDGSLFCERLTVAIEPGIPPDSIYKKTAS